MSDKTIYRHTAAQEELADGPEWKDRHDLSDRYQARLRHDMASKFQVRLYLGLVVVGLVLVLGVTAYNWATD